MWNSLVRTGLGAAALDWRDRVSLHRGVHRNLESVGTDANDMLARVLLERLCCDGGTFVDVGAHIGSIINGVQRRSSPGRVVAVEAIPEKAAMLKKRFPGVTLHACAVGDATGQIDFYVDEARPGYSSLDASLEGRSRTRRITVPIDTLDRLLDHHGVDLIKIDVEGAELGVLRGASSVVAASRPTIMFESGPDEMDGFPKSSLWQWFDDCDYDVLVPNRVAHNGSGMSLEVFVEAHLYPRRTTNYFGIARERRDAVRMRARQVLGL